MPDPLRGGNSEIARSFRTKLEAEDWLASQRASQLRGTYVDARQGDRPFSDLLDAWKQSWTNRLGATTSRRYQSIIDKYLKPEFGHVPIAKVTHERVQRYINRLNEDPKIAAGTVRNVYGVLRTACAKGVRLGMLHASPCSQIDLPRARRQEMLFLSADEVRAVAEAIDPRYRVLIYTAAYTGLRAGEIAGLERRDVDLLRGVIHVRRALKDVNGRLELGPTKTHATRAVSLPKFLTEMLREHLNDVSGGTGPEAPVFTGKGGGRVRMSLVYGRYFKRAVQGWTDKRGGKKHPGVLPERLHKIRFHDLRHTCAALSIQAGAHPKLISARLGHSSITVTLDRYGHMFPSMEEALAEALNAAFVEERGARTTDPVASLSG
jgi:integrase